jgi:EAL domain-containing protein (putative c-di-GMP-specific phosphodiesterase class I)
VPFEFIPLAEETRLIVDLGRWVLHEATRQAAEWHAGPRMGRPWVSVNLSGLQLLDAGLDAEVAAALAASALDPGGLMLEITETVFVQDVAAAVDRLEKLRAPGVSIAIDDFGTGDSSLRYIRRFPADVLKITKPFIDDLHDETDAALVRTIIALADSLRLRTVAEGIEDREQLARLSELGSTLGQGYVFARPPPRPTSSICSVARCSSPPEPGFRRGRRESKVVEAPALEHRPWGGRQLGRIDDLRRMEHRRRAELDSACGAAARSSTGPAPQSIPFASRVRCLVAPGTCRRRTALGPELLAAGPASHSSLLSIGSSRASCCCPGPAASDGELEPHPRPDGRPPARGERVDELQSIAAVPGSGAVRGDRAVAESSTSTRTTPFAVPALICNGAPAGRPAWRMPLATNSDIGSTDAKWGQAAERTATVSPERPDHRSAVALLSSRRVRGAHGWISARRLGSSGCADRPAWSRRRGHGPAPWPGRAAGRRERADPPPPRRGPTR